MHPPHLKKGNAVIFPIFTNSNYPSGYVTYGVLSRKNIDGDDVAVERHIIYGRLIAKQKGQICRHEFTQESFTVGLISAYSSDYSYYMQEFKNWPLEEFPTRKPRKHGI